MCVHPFTSVLFLWGRVYFCAQIFVFYLSTKYFCHLCWDQLLCDCRHSGLTWKEKKKTHTYSDKKNFRSSQEARNGSSTATTNRGTSSCQPHRDRVAADRSCGKPAGLQVELNGGNSASQCRRIKTQQAVKASAGRLKGKKEQRKSKEKKWDILEWWSQSPDPDPTEQLFSRTGHKDPQNEVAHKARVRVCRQTEGNSPLFPLLHQFLCLQMNEISFPREALLVLSVKDQLQTRVCTRLWHRVDDNMVGCQCSAMFGFDVSSSVRFCLIFFFYGCVISVREIYCALPRLSQQVALPGVFSRQQVSMYTPPHGPWWIMIS